MSARCRVAGGGITIGETVRLAAWDLGWRHGRDGLAPYQRSGEDSQAPDPMIAAVLDAAGPGTARAASLTPHDREVVAEWYAAGWERGHAERPLLRAAVHHEPDPEPVPGIGRGR